MPEAIRVLLTNDDGISAPGIAALERAFASLNNVELWVVAPDRGRSTTSHGMSLERPVFAAERGSHRIAVSGLPADCVFLALFGILKEMPHVVVSGINRGANLGCDVIYSGTVAAAREAVQRGVHGIAASLVSGDDYDRAARSVRDIAVELALVPNQPPRLLNLNYPAGQFKAPQFARLGVRNYPLRVTERAVPLNNKKYYWLGGPVIHDEPIRGTDSWLISQGIASATLLRLDQTDEKNMSCADELLPFMAP